MRLVAFVWSAALFAAGMGPAPFTAHTDLERDYYVYEPTGGGAGQPLVVFLHGCTQTAPDAAVGTRWTELAEARRFTVVFPEQSTAANGVGCWNWFLPEHQARGAGEPAIVAGITERVIDDVGADPSRVYLIGISAGADLAMVLGATYPDLFAAVSGFAGCAYASCTDVDGSRAHAAQGSRARVLPAMLVQGTADPLNDVAVGLTMATQWIGTNDLGDDGVANGSVPKVPTRVEHVGLDPSAADGAGTVGDVCVRNRQFPCASGLRGNGDYPYTVEHHVDASGCDVVDLWLIHGLSHAYPGGDPAGSFTDPAGPDLTTAVHDWFLRHKVGAPCAGVSSAPAATFASEATSGPAAAAELPRTGGPSRWLPLVTIGFVLPLGCRSWLRSRVRRPAATPR